jgi:hypothetical protein
MPDFITLTCPTCGGKLQITNSIDCFACGHCGNEHIVRREGGIVYLSPLVEGLQQIRTGVDKTAAELAIVRLPREIAELERQLHEVSLPIGPPALLEPPPWWDLVLNLVLFALIMPILVFFVFLVSGAHPVLVLVVWAVSVLVGFWYGFRRRYKEKQRILASRRATTTRWQTILDQQQAEITELQAKLESKRAQLRENQKILDG